MRCSSCEPLLDRYLEGTLLPRQMTAISAHVRTCSGCAGLLEELKAVDGLLATTRVFDVPENFTFAVMAEVRALPAPRAVQHPVWSFLVLYSTAAWVAAVIGMAFTGTAPGTVFAAISGALGRIGVISGAVSGGFSHSVAQSTPTLLTLGGSVLAVDFGLAGAFALLYLVIRPRLAARLATSAESTS